MFDFECFGWPNNNNNNWQTQKFNPDPNQNIKGDPSKTFPIRPKILLITKYWCNGVVNLIALNLFVKVLRLLVFWEKNLDRYRYR